MSDIERFNAEFAGEYLGDEWVVRASDYDALEQSMRAQVEQERARVAELSKYIVSQGQRFHGDHACAQCYPHSDILIDGFECGYHMAQRLRQQADEIKKGGK